MYAVILFIVLVILLFAIYDKKRCKYGVDMVISGVFGEDKFNESAAKRVINKLSSIGLPDDIAEAAALIHSRTKLGGFDAHTHDILDKKKARLMELEQPTPHKFDPDWELLSYVNTRADPETLARALKLKGCIYDREMELMHCFVLNDEDPLLWLPFYNENILRQEVGYFIYNSMKKKLDTYPIPLQTAYLEGDDTLDIPIKVYALDKVVDEYKFLDKGLLQSILRECIDFTTTPQPPEDALSLEPEILAI